MAGESLLISAGHPDALPGADGVLAHLRRLPAPAPAVMAMLGEAFDSPFAATDRFDFLATDRRFARAYLHYLVGRDGPPVHGDRCISGPATSVFQVEQLLRSRTPARPAVDPGCFALACGTMADFADRLPVAGPRFGRRNFGSAPFWRHSAAVAVVARELAFQSSRAADEDGIRRDCAAAFAAGLWHDIGRLILAHLYPKTYERICGRAEQLGVSLSEAEVALLGCDHALVGKRAAVAWGCPEPLTRAVWLHHQGGFSDPSPSSRERLPATVQLADAIARRAEVGLSVGRSETDIPSLAAALGLTRAELDDVCDPWLSEAGRMADAVLGAIRLDAAADEGCDDGAPGFHAPVGEFWLANRAAVTAARFAVAASIWDGALARSPDRIGAAEAVAQAMGSLLGATEALTLVRASDDSTWEAVEWRSVGSPDAASVVHGIAAPSTSEAGHTLFGQTAVGLAQDEAIARRWRLSFGAAPKRGLFFLPFTCRDRCQAVCVFSAAEVAPRVGECDPEQLRGLCESIGLGLANVAARCDAERVAEGLADRSRRLGEQLPQRVRSSTVAALAATASGAAHELNNPLAVISGRAQLLLSTAADPDVARHMRIIKEQADRAAAMALDLMTYAKPPAPAVTPSVVRPIVEAACQHCGERFGLLPGQIEPRFADSGLVATLDPNHLRSILDALLANAAAALPPQTGHIIVNSASLATDDKVRIVVEDNGCGMDRNVLEHAFDPFFSHRSAGRGRGMGLSIASRLAEAGGGRITLSSRPGERTVAVVEMPTGQLAS